MVALYTQVPGKGAIGRFGIYDQRQPEKRSAEADTIEGRQRLQQRFAKVTRSFENNTRGIIIVNAAQNFKLLKQAVINHLISCKADKAWCIFIVGGIDRVLHERKK